MTFPSAAIQPPTTTFVRSDDGSRAISSAAITAAPATTASETTDRTAAPLPFIAAPPPLPAPPPPLGVRHVQQPRRRPPRVDARRHQPRLVLHQARAVLRQHPPPHDARPVRRESLA